MHHSARQPLPLHRLPEDRGRHPRLRGDAPRESRPPAPRRRPIRPPARCDGQGHGKGALRHRPEPAGDAARRALAVASRARADPGSIDVTAARAVPGVHAVVTSADLDWCDPYFGPAFRDRPILAIDVVRYEGEPVAAAVAEDEAAAREALERIDVDYEPLTAVTTIEEALAPGAPLVHTGEPLAGHFADLSTLSPSRAAMSAISSISSAGAAPPPSPRPTWSSRTAIPSRACSTIPWSPTARWPPGTRRAASPSGPPRRIRTPCGSSSPRCSACRSTGSASSCRSSAAASAARPTRRSSPFTSALRASRAGRCASPSPRRTPSAPSAAAMPACASSSD